MRLLGLSGSLRSQSSCAALLKAAAKLLPAGATMEVWSEQLAELPHFTPDLDEEGSTAPAPVTALRAALRSADGVMICCPEYAHGIPGSFKNALDWTVSSGEWGRKPVAVLMASPSGAPYAHAALMPTLQVIEANIVFDVELAFFRKHLGASQDIINPRVKERVIEALVSLSALPR